MVADPGRCAIVWSRSRTALPPSGSAPNTQLSASDARKSSKANGAKDAAFRAALLGLPWNLTALGVSALSSFAMLAYGLFYFRRTERRFADVA